jgi:DNA-binding CsgD family transcriptional regulator
MDGAGWGSLTVRERELIYPVTEGKANKLIAMELGISTRTVEAHRTRIFRKMGVKNAVQLARTVYATPEIAEKMLADNADLAVPSPEQLSQSAKPLSQGLDQALTLSYSLARSPYRAR